MCCPLCGLSVPFKTFWDGIEQDVDDVEIVSFRGLGRGRGFEKTEAVSVLDDEEVCNAIARRCHAILDLLVENRASQADVEESGVAQDYSELLARVNHTLPEAVPWIDDLEEAVNQLIIYYEDCCQELSDLL